MQRAAQPRMKVRGFTVDAHKLQGYAVWRTVVSGFRTRYKRTRNASWCHRVQYDDFHGNLILTITNKTEVSEEKTITISVG